MNDLALLEKIEIDTRDWEKTPASVKDIVVQLLKRIEQLEQNQQKLLHSTEQLEEKVNQNSGNSHIAPSSDQPKFESKKPKKSSGKKRGGQKGHPGHGRYLYDLTECDVIKDHYPETCTCCGEKLTGLDKNPYRHQVVEIPPIKLYIEEHRLHQLSCNHCGQKTRASLPNFQGILNSDRYNAYNWLDISQRQLCWAHLKREFTKISERSGISRQIGRDLLAQEKKLFRLWKRVRDGTLSRSDFQTLVLPIRGRLKNILSQGAGYQIGSKEKTPLAKTVRTCRQLLKVELALWLFVTVGGLEPTNNAAERAIRPAVLWRKTSFGSQSEEGSIFAARMLTVVTSLRSQNRNVLEFMTLAIQALRQGTSPPSLIPITDSETEFVTLVA